MQTLRRLLSRFTPPAVKQRIRRILRLDLAVRFVWQSAPGWTVASLVIVVAQGLLPLLSLYLTKLVFDAIAAGLAALDKPEAFWQAALYVGALMGARLLGVVLGSLSSLVGEAQNLTVSDHMSDIIHAKSIAVDLEYYESMHYYDTLRRAQQEAPYRPQRIVNGLVQTAQNSISMLATVGLLLSFHWAASLILFVAILPSVWVRLRYSGKIYEWQREHTMAERRAIYYDWMLTGGEHAKEIRLFGLGELFMRRFRQLRQQLRGGRLRLARENTGMSLVTQVSTVLAALAAYAFIAYRAVQGSITLGDLVMFFQAFEGGQGYLRSVLGSLAGLYEDSLFLTNLYEFLDLQPKVAEPPRPAPVPRPMQTGVAFEHVNFKYPTGVRPVLEDISLTIRPGEVVALVGENGSGKTTLIKLLCRLYDPVGGAITLDGVDLRQFATPALRRQITVIFQDYVRYQMTVRENIWLGNTDLPEDNAQMVAAAQLAGADEVIRKLPQGYETLLGKWFGGEDLSIGEWQKLALARAFLRDAQLIVLDEPTSAMDAKAEHEVFEKFRQLIQGRSAILISHRFSTVKMADRIFVLDGGKIIESGSHDELVRLDGTYARLYEAQAQHYR